MYGGTKKEMERLLKDATKLSGVKYDISNLGDVYEAIHVIQKEIGITGTTALEAEKTLTGSFASMGASFQNLIGNIAIGNGTISQDMMALGETIKTFLFNNLIPMLWNIVSSLPQLAYNLISGMGPIMLQGGKKLLLNISKGISTGLPNFMNTVNEVINQVINFLFETVPLFIEQGIAFIFGLIDGIIDTTPDIVATILNVVQQLSNKLKENLPLFLENGRDIIFGLIEGIIHRLPDIVATILNVVQQLIDTIKENLPFYVEKGREFILSMISGLMDSLPQIIHTVGNIISQIILFIAKNLPKFLLMGLKMIVELEVGIIKALPGLYAKIPGIIWAIVVEFAKIPGLLFNIGKQLIQGFWNGIKSMGSWIANKIKGFLGGIVGGIKSFFGIKSPSRLFKNEIGKYLPLGLAEGVENNLKPVSKAMDEMEKLTTEDFNSDVTFGTNLLNRAKSYAQSGLVSMKEELSLNAEFDVNIAGQSLGKFTKIISKEKDKQDELEFAY